MLLFVITLLFPTYSMTAPANQGRDDTIENAIKDDPTKGEARDLSFTFDLSWNAGLQSGSTASTVTFGEETTINTRVYRYRESATAPYLIKMAEAEGTINPTGYSGYFTYEGYTFNFLEITGITPRTISQIEAYASDLFMITSQGFTTLETGPITLPEIPALPPYMGIPFHDFTIEDLSFTALQASPVVKTISQTWDESQTVTVSGTAYIVMSEDECNPFSGLTEGVDYEIKALQSNPNNGKTPHARAVRRNGHPFVEIDSSFWESSSGGYRNSVMAHEMEHVHQMQAGRSDVSEYDHFRLEYEAFKAQIDFAADCVSQDTLSPSESSELDAKRQAIYDESGNLRSESEAKVWLEINFGYLFYDSSAGTL